MNRQDWTPDDLDDLADQVDQLSARLAALEARAVGAMVQQPDDQADAQLRSMLVPLLIEALKQRTSAPPKVG